MLAQKLRGAGLSGFKAGLVGHYKMLGNANDSSGFGNKGTLVNSPTLAADKYGNANSAYSFSGASSQYISISQNKSLSVYSDTIPFSVCGWVKGTATASAAVYTEGNTAALNPLFALTMDATNGQKFRVFLRNSSGTSYIAQVNSTTTVFDNTWHHFAFTCDMPAGTAKLWIDGTQDASNFNPSVAGGTMGVTLNTSTIAALIRTTTSSYLTGTVSDIRLYRRAITAPEAKFLATATVRL